MTNFHVETGGKLYIAGEYSILKAGQVAVLKNIPIKLSAIIDSSEQFHISSDMFDYSTDLTPDANYRLIQASIETVALLLGKDSTSLRPFDLSITGKLERNGKKFGIGSSGSVTVLTIKALAAFYHIHLSNDLLFKLSAYTLLKLGDNGSMGDIACIAYNQTIAYWSFDRKVITQKIHEMTFEQAIKLDWGYKIEVILPKLPCFFMVGWTGHPSISKDMVNKVINQIDRAFLENTQEATLAVIEALKLGNKSQFVTALKRADQSLEALSSAIYTEDLTSLRQASDDLEVVAKSSGSGGGDCGIAFAFTEADSQVLKERWSKEAIQLIYHERLGE
ncbi:phosphomevalonate kinase [Streptococcus hongkongensis]|nr:phosphomevalonate kinase [Streptococcus uberis]